MSPRPSPCRCCRGRQLRVRHGCLLLSDAKLGDTGRVLISAPTARKIVFCKWPLRPLSDVFLMQWAQKHSRSLLTKETLNESAREGLQPQVSSKRARMPPQETKTQLDWITSRSITNRRLPTLDVFSEIYQAHVDRIEYEFGEVAAAKKLGNNSDSCYTKRLSVDVPERAYSTVCWNPDRKYELSFAYHRSGISNMIQGTDCGSTPVRTTFLLSARSRPSVANWPAVAQRRPRHSNRSLGASASRALRTSHRGLTSELPITSMPVHTRVELDIVRAQPGMTLMRPYSEDLRRALLDAGLPYPARCDDGRERIFAKRRKKKFVVIAYMIKCKSEDGPASRRKFCTCIWYAAASMSNS